MLIRTKEVCRMMGLSKNGLHNIIKNDPSFPKFFKVGETRQAPVYFRKEEIMMWLNKQNNSKFSGQE